ncbi:MAG TPA: hypothetical protein VNT75_13640 [Symbiobacteriaceae bacterium]|nr:hypothetical protein [Symbiobacteriaceae bacterium]
MPQPVHTHAPRQTDETQVPATVGYWAALTSTVAGVAYALVVGFMIATGTFTFPPAEWVQTFAAIVTIASGPLLVATLAAVHYVTPSGRRLLSLLGVLFATGFMVMVSINRFVQLAVVRLSTIKGNTAGLERFMPYGTQSAMLALEMVGWGFFLGLALLCTAFAFPAKERLLRWTSLTYALLALIGIVAFVVDSPVSMVGFVAWGLILPILTGLLAAWFRRLPR